MLRRVVRLLAHFSCDLLSHRANISYGVTARDRSLSLSEQAWKTGLSRSLARRKGRRPSILRL